MCATAHRKASQAQSGGRPSSINNISMDDASVEKGTAKLDPNSSSSAERDAKRHKADASPASPFVLRDYVRPHVLDAVASIHQAYATAQPWPHAVVADVFFSDFLAATIREIQQHSKVSFKESDLFRVYQSMDLANLTALADAATMPHVYKLREILASADFRAFIEGVCGLPPGTLTDQMDCACNAHIAGCHLLTHDDVIRTRKVSYILYLTEEGWTTQEGGALELYDRYQVAALEGSSRENNHNDWVPAAVPTTTHAPVRNSLACFVVEPGKSFHAVQEVLGPRPRLSLQGWYHAAEGPARMEQATLARLQDRRDTEDFSSTPYAANDEEEEDDEALAREETDDDVLLSQADRQYLANYVQATYLQPAAVQDIQARFEEDSSVQLREFLSEEWMQKLAPQLKAEDEKDRRVNAAKDYYQQGVKEGWTMVGPAHKQRFLEYQATGSVADPTSVGEIMAVIRSELLESQPFRRYLSVLTSLGRPLGFRGRTRRFRRGLDYTVAHHGLLTEESVLDATICFVAGRGKDVQTDMEGDQEAIHDADVQWQSGDFGGFECYIAADEEDEEAVAADEYNEDDDTELLSVSASNNTLSLVYRDPGTMRFVKYVGSKAPSSRWDVAMIYEVEQEEGQEEEEQEEPAEDS